MKVLAVLAFLWICESDGMIVQPRDIRWHRDSLGRRYGVHFTDTECGHVHWMRGGK